MPPSFGSCRWRCTAATMTVRCSAPLHSCAAPPCPPRCSPPIARWTAMPRAGVQPGNQLYVGGFAVALAHRGVASVPRFEWTIDPDATGLATVEAVSGGGAVLRGRSDAGAAATLASQALALAPGRYTLTMDIDAGGERDMAGFAIAARCAGSAAALTPDNPDLRPLGSARLRLVAAIEVPAGCARQDLVIRARGGTPVGATITLGNVAMRQAGCWRRVRPPRSTRSSSTTWSRPIR